MLSRSLYKVYSIIPSAPLHGLLCGAYHWVRSLDKRRHIVATVDGVTYQLDLTELIDSSIYYKGSFEPETALLISRLVTKGMVAIDIGANIGCHTFRLAQCVGDTGLVIAFEPMGWAYRKLRLNASLNRFNNIIFEKLALGAQADVLQAAFRTSWPIFGEKPATIAECVRVDTLDGYLRERQIDRVDFVKLDVDGHEFKVLQGAEKMLRRDMPLIVMEYSDWSTKRFGDEPTQMLQFLQAMGYEFYGGKEFSTLQSVEHLADLYLSDKTINILLRHPETREA